MTPMLRLRAAFSAGLLCCMSSVGLGLIAGCAPDPGDADEVEDRPELIERFGRVAQALVTDVTVYANTSFAAPVTRIDLDTGGLAP